VFKALQPDGILMISEHWHICAGQGVRIRAVLRIDTGVRDGYLDFSLRALDISREKRDWLRKRRVIVLSHRVWLLGEAFSKIARRVESDIGT
jgi:hypothetical protein